MALNRNVFKTAAFQDDKGDIYYADIYSDNDSAQCRFDSRAEADVFLTWANNLKIFSEALFVISEDNVHTIPLSAEDYFLLYTLAIHDGMRMAPPPVREFEFEYAAAAAAAVYIPPAPVAAPAPAQPVAAEEIAVVINQGLAAQDEVSVAQMLAQIDAKLDAIAAAQEEENFQHAIRLSQADQATRERLERERLAREQAISAQQQRLLEQANRLREQRFNVQQAPQVNPAQQAQQNLFRQQAEIAARLKEQHEAQKAAEVAAAEAKERFLKQVEEKQRAEQAAKLAAEQKVRELAAKQAAEAKAKEEALAKAQAAERVAQALEAERVAKAQEAERIAKEQAAKALEEELAAKALKEEQLRQELEEVAAGAKLDAQLVIMDDYSPASAVQANSASSSSAVAVVAEEEKADQKAPIKADTSGQKGTPGFLSGLANKMGLFKPATPEESKNTSTSTSHIVPRGEEEESAPYRYYGNNCL